MKALIVIDMLNDFVTGVLPNEAEAKAFTRGYRIIAPSGAVCAFAGENQQAALDYMKIYGAEITTSATLCAASGTGLPV